MKATNRILPNYMECGVGAPLTDYTAGTMKAMAAVSGYDVLHCDENVSALLRPSNKTSIKWEKSEHDSIENIIAIEASQ
jgi:hypothetical protein